MAKTSSQEETGLSWEFGFPLVLNFNCLSIYLLVQEMFVCLGHSDSNLSLMIPPLTGNVPALPKQLFSTSDKMTSVLPVPGPPRTITPLLVGKCEDR